MAMDAYEIMVFSILSATALTAVAAKIKELFDVCSGSIDKQKLNKYVRDHYPHVTNAPPNWAQLMMQDPNYHPAIATNRSLLPSHRITRLTLGSLKALITALRFCASRRVLRKYYLPLVGRRSSSGLKPTPPHFLARALALRSPLTLRNRSAFASLRTSFCLSNHNQHQ